MSWNAIRLTGTPAGSPWSYISEIELIDPSGSNVVTGAQVFASSYAGPNYAPGQTINGVVDDGGFSWGFSTASPCWIAFLKQGMNPAKIRIIVPSGGYSGMTDCVVEGSNDTTNGVDGTWFQLATGVATGASGVWCEFALPYAEAPALASSLIPLPAILNALPASLSRGFR